jgi:hypothetical protein
MGFDVTTNREVFRNMLVVHGISGFHGEMGSFLWISWGFMINIY